MTSLQRWNIAAGNFFFRYRNALFPVIFSVTTLVARPRLLFHDNFSEHFLAVAGAGVAIMGEGVRLATIGFRYIERGGRQGRVYASRLVRRGMYGVTRNPMYLGNLLIATGLSLMTESPTVWLIVLPFFYFVYQAIVCAEEAFLRGRFEAGYTQYCATVNRFLPTIGRMRRAFAGTRFHWKRAVRQDLSTLIALSLGLVLVPLWRIYFLEGRVSAKALLPQTLAKVTVILILYVILHYLKKRKLLT